jgi:hypothetical protein
MAKNLIIGGFTGYNYNQLKPWVESIDSCGFVGDKVMIVGDASDDTKKQLIKRGFKLYDMPRINAPIHVARFWSIYDFLYNNWKQYNIVVSTDVKDVYFQKDPCKWIFDSMGEKSLVAGSESMYYKDEPWGNDNLMQAYGPEVHEKFKNNIIYNVGTIGGKSEYVKDMCFNIFTNSINRPIPIVDQAVYNVLLQTQPYKDNVLFTNQEDGWAVQLGTTGDPSKMDYFRPFLTEPEPIFNYEVGLVTTTKNEPHCIVHQYDRVPKWKQLVMEKFNQEDPNNFFTYRTTT